MHMQRACHLRTAYEPRYRLTTVNSPEVIRSPGSIVRSTSTWRKIEKRRRDVLLERAASSEARRRDRGGFHGIILVGSRPWQGSFAWPRKSRALRAAPEL